MASPASYPKQLLGLNVDRDVTYGPEVHLAQLQQVLGLLFMSAAVVPAMPGPENLPSPSSRLQASVGAVTVEGAPIVHGFGYCLGW